MSEFKSEPFGGSKFKPTLSKEAKAVVQEARD